MKTTDKIRELKNSCSEWIMPTSEFINNAARMAELLEKAENIMRYYADTDDVIVHPMNEWLEEFSKFQAGEK